MASKTTRKHQHPRSSNRNNNKRSSTLTPHQACQHLPPSRNSPHLPSRLPTSRTAQLQEIRNTILRRVPHMLRVPYHKHLRNKYSCRPQTVGVFSGCLP